MLEPDFDDDILPLLDKLEHDASRRPLWDAICDAVDLVCDHPDSAEARRDVLQTLDGRTIWQVPVRCRTEDDDWVMLWYPDGIDARIAYIGPSMFR